MHTDARHFGIVAWLHALTDHGGEPTIDLDAKKCA